jgi:SNF family Na+-dependent transporter
LGKALDGSVMQTDMAALGQLFGAYVSNPALSLSSHAIFAAATLIIVLMGVQKGIERASKLMMPALFLLMLVLIIRALTLDNAMLGLTRFFTPDWSKVNGVMLIDALGLACFSLSVGAGCMLAYGSYLNKSARLASSALWITGLTSLTSLLVGLMIFPAIFAITKDPFIVLTANIFAILGLRALYFLLADLADRFHLLPYGLALVLIFIGAKMLMIDFYKIPIGVALMVTASLIASSIVISIWHTRKK